jgi:RNA polymerase sigma-70 factor, ECF subfamily
MQSSSASNLGGSWESFLEPEVTQGSLEHRKLLLDLYDREQVPLRRYLMFLSVKPESAEEFVQEAFLRLHQHLGVGGERTNLRAWLYRVVHNLAMSEMQTARNRRSETIEESAIAGQIEDRRDNPEEILLASQRQRSVEAALATLPEPQRRCLVLRSQGLKYREIAEVLGLSTSTVGEHIQRGINQIKESL